MSSWAIISAPVSWNLSCNCEHCDWSGLNDQLNGNIFAYRLPLYNPFVVLCLFALQGLNNKKSLPAGGTMLHCLENIATFMEALPMDSPSNLWTTICNQFQTFLTKLPSVLPLKVDIESCRHLVMLWYGLMWLWPEEKAFCSVLVGFNRMDSQKCNWFDSEAFYLEGQIRIQ